MTRSSPTPKSHGLAGSRGAAVLLDVCAFGYTVPGLGTSTCSGRAEGTQ
jgi:hypothetical protein